jgi:hypothetical protein
MMEVLQKGTVESLLIAMRDRLEVLTDLDDVTNRLFDTTRKDDDSPVQTNVAWFTHASKPMTGIFTIDTTLAAYVPGEEYKLYIKFTSGVDTVVKGPIFFRVEDD